MKKLLSFILVLVFMIGFPLSADAVYYDRAGNPIQPKTRPRHVQKQAQKYLISLSSSRGGKDKPNKLITS